jgi:regulator of cell morphogenesis and NO signaling
MVKTIDPAMTLGDLVNAHPQLAREFEIRGLDCCCGGQQSLADACASRGLDAVATSHELAATVTVDDAGTWGTLSASELVDHLESTHHRYLWEELPRLSALVAKIVGVHGERHPELGDVAACYEQVRADLEPHLLNEERVLFPMIRVSISHPQMGARRMWRASQVSPSWRRTHTCTSTRRTTCCSRS